MVTTVNDRAVSRYAIDHERPLLVELIGLAGAGKTRLSKALKQHDESIAIAADLELRNPKHLPIFFVNAPFLLPTLLRQSWRRNSRLTWDEIKAMVYLRGWPRVLRQQAQSSYSAILLDHGPIFKLATLHAFGPEQLKSRRFDKWWRCMLKEWVETLDIVVWLDAPSGILVQRINARNQKHAVKGKSELEAYKFLARYQNAYDQILSKFTALGGSTPILFNTDQTPVEQIVDSVMFAFTSKQSEIEEL